MRELESWPLLRRFDRILQHPTEIVVALLVIAATQITLDGGQSSGVRGTPVRLDVAHIVSGAVAESHALDTLDHDGSSDAISAGMAPISVSRGRPVQIVGWALDRTAGRPSYAVYVTLGATLYAYRTGLERDDVAAAYGDRRYAAAGFSLDLPANALPLGPVTLVVHGVSADGLHSYAIDPPVPLVVTP